MRHFAGFYFLSGNIVSLLFIISTALDTISKDSPIKDGYTIVSAGGNFELGFFSLGNSKNRYVGIWYKKISKEVVWVANRANPLNNISGTLTVSDKGILLLNGTEGIIWSTNSSTSLRNPVAQLLDTGNLVLKDGTDLVWQSFDYPGNTLLPGMKIGHNLVTGLDRSLTSWKSSDDPSPGEYVSRLDTNGYPQIILWEGPVIKYSSGPWNGRLLTGRPNMKPNPYFTFEFVFNETEIYYRYNLIHASLPTRVVMIPTGLIQELVWIDRTQSWLLYSTAQIDTCDRYALCGQFGRCNTKDSPPCACLRGFEPKYPQQWNAADWSNGCVRRTPLECGTKGKQDMELPLFDLMTITAATKNFSSDNLIGEGGFGPVYQGKLSTGSEIAVKKLSKHSGQGLEELKNEVVLISKLQHRNLVKLLGCCLEGEERMLVYEYMPNSSLDHFIFDDSRKRRLSWENRFQIAMGISRGLLYLHQDSRLRIIHRDLKTSNILLDSELKPKISDFGLARIFGGDQIEAKTKRVMGTYGYMSPEYAVDGKFSMKSDVFGLGVLLLELVSGRKNRTFHHLGHHHNLLGHAWLLWNEGKALELMDTCLKESVVESQMLRCIHAGLLCVQKLTADRPTMASVVFMLSNEKVGLPQPKEPGFFIERSTDESNEKICLTDNVLTLTILEPR
nr:G-type lectin S-receptor-like serine/threonine-protein kinase At4g27290 [Nicotiana tomentosiformis]